VDDPAGGQLSGWCRHGLANGEPVRVSFGAKAPAGI
jgi:hypothetical protein